MGDVALADRQTISTIVGFVLLLALAVVIVVRAMRRREAEARLIITADFVERTDATVVGGISFAMLLIWNVGAFTLFFGGVLKTSIHEIATLLLWLGGNQLWIAGITLGRRRRFIMRQQRKVAEVERHEPVP